MRNFILFTLMLMLSLLLSARYGFADGFRRNIASASKEERDRFRDAIIALNTNSCRYPGTRDQKPPGGVTCWFKQDEIHAGSHVHVGPAFIPWHRELLNRFEVLLQQIDPSVPLFYWDWTTDPTWMFTSDFMGSAQGEAGDPWLAVGFYNPNANPCRSENEFDRNNNPADPPCSLTRNVDASRLITPAEERHVLEAETFEEFDFRIRPLHGRAHIETIGGTLLDAHTSFRDPFVFLLHSNIDRLFATWQLQAGHPERLDPQLVYGSLSNTRGNGDVAFGDAFWGILSPLEPWAGPGAQHASTGVIDNVEPVRPWAPPENQQEVKDSKDPSVVTPPHYADSNINDLVSFDKIIPSHPIDEPIECPRESEFGAIFKFSGRLKLKAGSPPDRTLTDLLVSVRELTNENLIVLPSGATEGVGARFPVPNTDGFVDGILSQSEFVDVPFIICLNTPAGKEDLRPFSFFVDVLAVVDGD